METQLHGHHHYQEDVQNPGLPSVMEGGNEIEHEEKKSVLKKVKDKAKKIKNTIKKHAHGHDHEEENDDDHAPNHPQPHGPPMHESSVVRSTDIPKEGITNLENPRYKREDRYDDAPQNKTPNNTPEHFPSPPAHLVPQLDNSSVDEKRADTASHVQFNPATKTEASPKPISETASRYAHKVAEMLGLVSGSGDAVKGVSMKEYLSEKLRPGDEDRELCKVITNALEKKKEKGNEQAVGKVTMSDEVAARLGDAETRREGKDAVESGQQSSGQGLVDRLRDAVGLWLGKSTGIQTAQDSIAASFGSGSREGS